MGVWKSLVRKLKAVHLVALNLARCVSHELLHMNSLKILEKGSSSGNFVVCVEQSIQAV